MTAGYKHFNRFITKPNIFCTTHEKGYPFVLGMWKKTSDYPFLFD